MRDNQHTWFIVSGITGILFIIWGSIATEARPLIPGDLWLILPGCMLLLVSIVGILEGLITDIRILKYFNKQTTKEIVPSVAAKDLRMSLDYFMQRILALKMNGKLLFSFHPTTGVILRTEIMNKYICTHCGHLDVTNEFCPVCGTMKTIDNAK